MGEGKRLLAVFGHHKAASSWVGNVSESASVVTGLRYGTANCPHWFGRDLQKHVEQIGIEFLNYMNADFQYVSSLRDFRGFHVVRDPRDMAVSAYFSHRFSHSDEWWPELTEHRRRLKELPVGEGLMLDIEFTARLRTDGMDLNPFQAMRDWPYGSENILEVRYEDLLVDAVGKFREIFSFLGMVGDGGLSEEALLEVVRKNDFSIQSKGRQRGEEDERNEIRKAVPGDWRIHFGPEHKELFKERYNDLLVRLGYESAREW